MVKIKNRVSKKAQAAMEFLTTYGWAILILIIVIVALANLGVFRAPVTPNSCIVSGPFVCADVIVRVAISNNGLGNTISNLTIKANNVQSMSIGAFRSNGGTCTGTIYPITGAPAFNGNGDNYVGLDCPASVAGNKEIGEIDLVYVLAGGGGAPHTTTLSYSATRE